MPRERKFPWFRVYSELANERKLLMISRLVGLSKCEVIGAFTIMMCMANDSPERGKLLIAENMPYTLTDIASELEIDPTSYQKLDSELVRFGLISWDDGVCTIRNWNKRQHKSDDPYERVTKFRDNEKQAVTTPLQDSYNAVVVTVDSASASASDSLIKKNRILGISEFQDISARDAERIYTDITGQPTIPPNQYDSALPLLMSIVASYDDHQKMHDDGLGHFVRWCNTRGKNGRNYTRTNTAWLDRWYESIAPDPGQSKKEKIDAPLALCGTGQALKRKAEDLGDRDHEPAVIEFRKHIDTCRICGGKEIESKPMPDDAKRNLQKLLKGKVINNENGR